MEHVPDISNPFAAIAQGVGEEACQESYSVFSCSSEESPQREAKLLRSLPGGEDKEV
jgi:DNA-binding LacI/PurR family transcriptional regulator